MKSHINNVPISEFAIVIGGYAFKSEDFIGEGIPVIKIKNIGNKKLSFEDTDYLPHSFLDIPDKFKIKFGDVLISMTGSHITQPNSAVGRVARSYSREISLLNQRVGKMQVNPKKCDLGFLYHFMSSDVFRDQIGLRSRGAANQANVSGKDIEGIPIPNFSLEAQQKIAAILSAYDDLIENNLKRIKLLEEMAQITYEEWFVRLKFPGHENTPMNSETRLPEGWCFGKALDLFELQRGFDLPIQEREDGVIPIIASTGVTGFHSSYKIQGPGVVTGRSGTIGQVMFIDSDFWPLNTTLWVKKCKSCGPIFVKYFLQNFNLESLCGGSAVPSLDRKAVHVQKIVIPSAKLMKKFEIYASSLYENTKVLHSQNELLKEARDILLPRLMTGMIDVEQLVLPESFSNTASSPEQESQAA
jgi:type I restriction enzyme, S subunit